MVEMELPSEAVRGPNQRTVAIGNIDNFELCSGEFQDAALDDAKRAPGKLNELDHVVCLKAPQATLGPGFRGDKRNENCRTPPQKNTPLYTTGHRD